MQNHVSVYSSEGQRIGSRSVEGAIRLEKLKLATVMRSRRGDVLRVYMNKADGGSPLSDTIYVGTKYSYREHLPSGHRCHDLKRLGGARGGTNYAPEELRPIFLQVLRECLVSA